MDKVKIVERLVNSDESTFFNISPFLDEWLFIFVSSDLTTVNITLTDKIIKI